MSVMHNGSNFVLNDLYLTNAPVASRRRGIDDVICLDNFSKLERRRKVLLFHKPSIDQFPLLIRVRELNLEKLISRGTIQGVRRTYLKSPQHARYKLIDLQ